MRRAGRPRNGVPDMAFEAAGGDPLLALLIVLDLIWDGKLTVSGFGREKSDYLPLRRAA